MKQMTFKRELGKTLMARVVQPGMWTAAKMMSMCEQVEGEPIVEIFDADHSTYVGPNGKRLGHLLETKPLSEFIEMLEDNKSGVDFSGDVEVPQWGLSAPQCKRLLGKLREIQETYEHEQSPGMSM